jgi:hypothetical protein
MYFNRNEQIFTWRRLKYFLASMLFLFLTLLGLGTLASKGVLGTWFTTGTIWTFFSGFAACASQIYLISIGLTAVKILTGIMVWLFFTTVHAFISDTSFLESWPGNQQFVRESQRYSFAQICHQALQVALCGSEKKLTDEGRRDTPFSGEKRFFVLMIHPATWIVFLFEFLKMAVSSLVHMFFRAFDSSREYAYSRYVREDSSSLSWSKFFVSFLFSLLLLPLKGLAGICNIPYWLCRVPHVIDLIHKEKRDKAEKVEMDAFLDMLLQEPDAAIGFESKSGKSKDQREIKRKENYRDLYSERRWKEKREKVRSALQDQWDSIHELQHEIRQLKLEPNYPGRDVSIRKAESWLKKANNCMLKTIAYLKEREHFRPLSIRDIVSFLSEANPHITKTIAAIEGTKVLQKNDYRCWMSAITDFELSEARKILEALHKRHPAYHTDTTLEGDNPLHYAAKKGKAHIMQILLQEQGADSTSLNREGHTAFQVLAKLYPNEYTQLHRNYAAYSGSQFTCQPTQNMLLSHLYGLQPEKYRADLAQKGGYVLCISISDNLFLSIPLDAWSNTETAIHAARRRIRAYRAYVEAYLKFFRKAGAAPPPTFFILPESLERESQYVFLILPRGYCALSHLDQDFYMREATERKALIFKNLHHIGIPTELISLMEEYGQAGNILQEGNFAEVLPSLVEAKDEKEIPSSFPVCPYASVAANLALLHAIVQGPFHRTRENLLLWTAKNNHPSMLEMLLKRGVNIEAKDYLGYTPLYHAVQSEDGAAMELLLRYGANTNLIFWDISVQREYKSCKETLKIQLDEMRKLQHEGDHLRSALHKMLMETYDSPFLRSKKNILDSRKDIKEEQGNIDAEKEKCWTVMNKISAHVYVSVDRKSSKTLKAEIATMQADMTEGKIRMEEMKIFFQQVRESIERIKQKCAAEEEVDAASASDAVVPDPVLSAAAGEALPFATLPIPLQDTNRFLPAPRPGQSVSPADLERVHQEGLKML